MEYRFIDNIGDYFNPGFFTEDFLAKVKSESGKTPDEVKALRNKLSQLNVAYKEYKKVIVNGRLSVRHQIRRTHEFHTELLKMLGYDPADAYKEWLWLDDTSVVPVRHIIRNSAGQTRMLIMEMQNLIPVGDEQPDGLSSSSTTRERMLLRDANSAIGSPTGATLWDFLFQKA